MLDSLAQHNPFPPLPSRSPNPRKLSSPPRPHPHHQIRAVPSGSFTQNRSRGAPQTVLAPQTTPAGSGPQAGSRGPAKTSCSVSPSPPPSPVRAKVIGTAMPSVLLAVPSPAALPSMGFRRTAYRPVQLSHPSAVAQRSPPTSPSCSVCSSTSSGLTLTANALAAAGTSEAVGRGPGLVVSQSDEPSERPQPTVRIWPKRSAETLSLALGLNDPVSPASTTTATAEQTSGVPVYNPSSSILYEESFETTRERRESSVDPPLTDSSGCSSTASPSLRSVGCSTASGFSV
eukprot:RCo004867